MYNIKKTYNFNYLYKITNVLDSKYYYGIHSTNNLDDNYFGSGVHLNRAIKKYGKENFIKEIIEFTEDRNSLLDLEKKYITESVVQDPNTYNVSLGGKSYIDSLKIIDTDFFKKHQQEVAKLGGKGAQMKMSVEQKRDWHSKGGLANYIKNKDTNPFFSKEVRGLAKKRTSETLKNTVELWNPESTVLNKNNVNYKPGWCKRYKGDSIEANKLISQGWLTTDQLRNKLL
jgi:hypothetical protein